MLNPTQKVLAALLRQSADKQWDAPPTIADTRLREVLQGGPAFTPAERRLMLQSPTTRERFIALAHGERIARRQAWGQIPRFACQAAAGNQNEIKIESVAAAPDFSTGSGDSCKLHLIKLDSQGQRWKISLRVTDTICRNSPAGVRLVDDTGREWLAGQPDEAGKLSGLWPFEESPLDWVPYHPTTLEPR